MRYLAFFTLLSVGTPMIVTNAYIRRMVVPPNGLTTDFDSTIIGVPTDRRVKNARFSSGIRISPSCSEISTYIYGQAYT